MLLKLNPVFSYIEVMLKRQNLTDAFAPVVLNFISNKNYLTDKFAYNLPHSFETHLLKTGIKHSREKSASLP